MLSPPRGISTPAIETGTRAHQICEDVHGPIAFIVPRHHGHAEAEVGVGGVGEEVDGVEGDVVVGAGPPGGVVQDPAAPDGGELVPVPEQRDPDTDLVGDDQERGGGGLVEHPGLVDKEQVSG